MFYRPASSEVGLFFALYVLSCLGELFTDDLKVFFGVGATDL